VSGRLPKWTEQDFQAILDDLAAGVPLNKALGGSRPGRTTVFKKLAEDADFARAYDRALISRAQVRIEKIETVVDKVLCGQYEPAAAKVALDSLAITVHKSQGMSLDAAVMDLSGAFEYGQGYVALSRVRSLEGLHLLGWNARALEVHPAVLRKDFEFRAASNALSAACGRRELRKSYTGPLCSTLER